jgi:hypothetical protein
MGNAARKLLEKMRATQSGWRQSDFERLLTGFGFKKKGKKHDIYIHPRFSDLRVSVPRHNSLKDWVSKEAVSAIDDLICRTEKEAPNGTDKDT